MTVRLTENQKIQILNAQDVYSIMQQVLLREKKIDRNKEHFWIIGLATNNQILFIELISLGSVKATIVEPMEVFSFALQKRAVKIIMVHNHPSGTLNPSKADIEITDKMVAIGKFLQMPIIDHFIISEKTYYSFTASGLLNEIEKNTHYDLSFKEIDNLKEKVEKQKSHALATKMLKKGVYSIEQITDLTGLSKAEIQSIKR
ncbi:MAG TPA: JAB domain-containing protein [Chitinophagaceae bacterium]|nr:JAB domain-containing protein [Chitinophagaceae bacterium]